MHQTTVVVLVVGGAYIKNWNIKYLFQQPSPPPSHFDDLQGKSMTGQIYGARLH